jgi:membrane dipeptidase
MMAIDPLILHKESIIIDAHSDILVPITDGICRLGERADIPAPEEWTGTFRYLVDRRATPYSLSQYAQTFGPAGQYDVPRFREGGLTCQVVAVYVSDKYLPMSLERFLDMRVALDEELNDNSNSLLLVKTSDDIRNAKSEGKTGLLLALEGAEPIGNRLGYFNLLHMLGVRMIGLGHSRRNQLADGNQMNTRTGGLSALGVKAVKHLNELGIVIDLAHMADSGFWQVLEVSKDPVVVSHGGVLTDRPGYSVPYLAIHPEYGKSKLQALAEKGGVIGVIFWDRPDLQAIVREISAAIEHVGPDHVGLGSDLFSLERAPTGLEHIGKLQALTESMSNSGLNDEVIVKVLGGNFLRVFDKVIGN